MSKYPKQAVDAKVQQDINDDRDHQRQHQGVPAVGAGTRNDPAERSVKGIGYGHDETNESRAASGRK